MTNAVPTSGTGGSIGLQTAYASTAATSIAAPASLSVSLTVPGARWYDCNVSVWLGTTTTGVGDVDGLNVGIYSDPVTSGTLVLQSIVPWNCLGISAIPVPQEFRLYAISTIAVQNLGAATTSTNYCINLVVARAEPGDAII